MSASTFISLDTLRNSFLIIFFTIFLIHILKVLMNIKFNVVSIGTDLNLFTFGFLFDTALKAMNGNQYWNNYSQSYFFGFSKNISLLLIFAFNMLLMMFNFKLEYYTANLLTLTSCPTRKVKYVYKPLIIFLGTLSLSIYLISTSIFE